MNNEQNISKPNKLEVAKNIVQVSRNIPKDVSIKPTLQPMKRETILPTKKTEISRDIRSYTTLLYGAPKVGKSTFCSKIDGALFLATEEGLNALEVMKTSIDSWETFLRVEDELCTTEHQFKTIIIDTIGNLFKMCVEYVCKKNGVTHESEMPFGKGYALIREEFTRSINRLSHSKFGLIMIAHSTLEEVETKLGKISKYIPELTKSIAPTIKALADFIFYIDFENINIKNSDKFYSKRFLKTKPTVQYDAGDRTGKLPESIELDYNVFLNEFSKIFDNTNGAKK